MNDSRNILVQYISLLTLPEIDSKITPPMYTVSGKTKRDPTKSWNRRDRAFFAAGACHILAYAFLERHKSKGFHALWIKPAEGFTGSHIVATNGKFIFDYHGLSDRNRYFQHLQKRAAQKWPGWSCELVDLPSDVLVSESKSKTYDGLWLREPGQYLYDALPRARRFLDRFADSLS